MTNDLDTGSSPLNSSGGKQPDKTDHIGPSPLDEGRADSEPVTPENEPAKDSVLSNTRGAERRKLPGQPMGFFKRILLFLALPLIFYSLAGFLLAPYLLTTTLPSFLSTRLNRPVTIGSARVNPYTLNVTLKNGIIGPDLSLSDDTVDPVFSFGRLEGRINPIFFLTKGQIITAIRGNSVFIHLSRQKDGLFNITTLLSRLNSSKKTFTFPHLADIFQSGDINFTDSRLLFTDQLSKSQHSLEEIRFSLPKRAKDSVAISPHFSAIIDGSPISVGGQSESSASGQNTRLTFTLEKINLADYLAYLPKPFPGLITKSETDMELLVDYQVSPDKSYHFEIMGSGIARDIWLHSPQKGENKIASAHFSLRFEPLLSQLTISKLILDQPEIQVQRQKDGTYIFPGLGKDNGTDQAPPINIETLVVKNGRLSFIDKKVKGGFGAILNDINLSITRDDKGGSMHAYALNCVTSRKTRIASQGKLSISKKNAAGLFILHNLPVAALNSYLPAEYGVTLSSGIIDKAEATLQFSLTGQKDSLFTLSGLKGTATNIDIYYQGKECLHIDSGLFADATFGSDSAQISLGNISLSGLLGHLSPTNSPFMFSLFSTGKQSTKEPFSRLEVKNGTLVLHDFSFQKEAELAVKIVKLQASGFGKKANIPGKIESTLILPKKGKCSLQGDLSTAPLAGNLKLSVEHLAINLFAGKEMAWFAPEVQTGTFDFDGIFSLADLSFKGRASLTDFLALNTSSRQKLITLKKASAPQIAFAIKPFTLQIKTLDLDALDLATTLSADADSLASLFLNDKKYEAMDLGNIAVQKITLKDSALHFRDETLNPPFAKSLTGINGSLRNLKNKTADSLMLDLACTNEDQAILKSKGSINLFSESFGADLNVTLVNQPLAPFIPYLEPMVGHRLSDAIFDLAVSYKESAGKVNANSLLTVRHLTLGDKDLGNRQFPTSVALVTDREQIIRLDIPIVGDMTDPSYTFHSAYGKKLRSLVSKASVSPFSMLTDFYDPEQNAPDHILFEVGGTEPTPEALPTLLAIKNILEDRPLLSVTIKGYSAGTKDRDALLLKKREEEAKKKLALQKSMSSDVISSYGKEEIEIPPAIPQAPSTTLFTVSKEELLALAKERCQRLKEILTTEYGVEDNRLLISPDTTVVPGTGAGLVGNRADFILGLQAKGANSTKQ